MKDPKINRIIGYGSVHLRMELTYLRTVALSDTVRFIVLPMSDSSFTGTMLSGIGSV